MGQINICSNQQSFKLGEQGKPQVYKCILCVVWYLWGIYCEGG